MPRLQTQNFFRPLNKSGGSGAYKPRVAGRMPQLSNLLWERSGILSAWSCWFSVASWDLPESILFSGGFKSMLVGPTLVEISFPCWLCVYIYMYTYYLLHITYYLIHITYYILHITYYILHITYTILHIPCTYYILHITSYILQITDYILHTPYSM